MPNNVRKLLIIRFSALGDVAILALVVRALAEQYPHTGIGVLSNSKFAALFQNMPKNVRFIRAELDNEHQGLKGLNQLLGDISYKQFDAVADMHDSIRSRWIDTRYKWLHKRVSVIQKGRWEKWKYIHHWGERTPLTPTIARYAAVLNRLGFPVVLPEKIVNDTAERKGIGIAPFAAYSGKMYPLDLMEQVVKALSEKGEPIYLFGGGYSESKILKAWANRYENVTCVANRYTLSQEMAIIKQLRVMLSMDSANMHIASLVGTRVISLWGATHPDLGFLGYGQAREDCVQRELKCRPCSVYGKDTCHYGDFRCMHIAPKKILSMLQE